MMKPRLSVDPAQLDQVSNPVHNQQIAQVFVGREKRFFPRAAIT
jgi:hypothetical protein